MRLARDLKLMVEFPFSMERAEARSSRVTCPGSCSVWHPLGEGCDFQGTGMCLLEEAPQGLTTEGTGCGCLHAFGVCGGGIVGL